MRRVTVDLQEGYEVFIGRHALSTVGPQLKKMGYSSKVVIVTNLTVNELYGTSIKESLLNEGFEVVVLEIPDTEKSKSLEMASKLYDELIRYRVDRETPIVAFGGGVVGDLAGFVAATFLRGLPLINIPTTLLAQVDSSIGGKTGVNHPEAKNIIGVFKQPSLVLTDLAVLSTLSERDMKNGIAEIVKHAVIADASLFETLESQMEEVLNGDRSLMEEIVERSCAIKIRVVEGDEKEKGMRRVLNYGHTIGHALEAATDFRISHGEAVAVGICVAGRIAGKMGIFDAESAERQEMLIERAGLPTRLPTVDLIEVVKRIELDKKVKKGRVHFVLPEAIGTVVINSDVPQKIVRDVLEELQ